MVIARRLFIWFASAVVVILAVIYAAEFITDPYRNPLLNDEVRGDPRGWNKTLRTLGSTYSPQWTPDGNKIVFMSKDTGTTYVVDRDGRELVSIGKKKERLAYDNSHAPDFPPDGTAVLYTTTSFREASERRRSGSDFELAIANLEGKEKERLAESSVDQLMPTWLPGGDRVAYVRHNPDYDYAQEVVALAADGQGPEKLVTRLKGNQLHGKPMWSLDGSRLSYMTKRLYIYSIGVNGDGPSRVLSPQQGGIKGDNPINDWSPPVEVKSLPARSPVSEEVAFLGATSRGNEGKELALMLYLVDTESGDTRLIPLEVLTR